MGFAPSFLEFGVCFATPQPFPPSLFPSDVEASWPFTAGKLSEKFKSISRLSLQRDIVENESRPKRFSDSFKAERILFHQMALLFKKRNSIDPNCRT